MLVIYLRSYMRRNIQMTTERENRRAFQSEVVINNKPYILRVIVEGDELVVTLYLTSKVDKYRGET